VTTARNGPRCPHLGRKPNDARKDMSGEISPENLPDPLKERRATGSPS